MPACVPVLPARMRERDEGKSFQPAASLGSICDLARMLYDTVLGLSFHFFGGMKILL